MPTLVDATVLSNLAAVGRLDLFGILSDTVYVVSAVYEEIQQGLDEGYEFLVEIDGVWTLAIWVLLRLKVTGSGTCSV